MTCWSSPILLEMVHAYAALCRQPFIWPPVFAIMLSGLWLAFRRVERG